MSSDAGYHSLPRDVEDPGKLDSDGASAWRQGCDKVKPSYRRILVSLAIGVVALPALYVLCNPSKPPVFAPRVENVTWAPFECPASKTSVLSDQVVLAQRKGLAVDDTTWDKCPGSIPVTWPGTAGGAGNQVGTVRLFRTGSESKESMSKLKRFLAYNSGKALVGAPITCDQEADDVEWRNTVEALRILGPEHVVGVAIGNELDLLHNYPNKCAGDVWGYFKKNFMQRMKELLILDSGAFANISLTTVTAASIARCGDSSCSPQNMTLTPEFSEVLQFIYQRVPADKFVISLNLYPYFTPCSPLGADQETPVFSCSEWLHLSSCVDEEKCVLRQSLISTRLALEGALGETGRNARLWIGEVGWSSPQSSTMSAGSCQGKPGTWYGNGREVCPSWSSASSYATAYDAFLKWDLSVSAGMVPVELAFWFSIRDSTNFDVTEHFGLCGGPGAPWWAIGGGEETCHNDISRV